MTNEHELIVSALRERQNLSAEAAENVIKELERGVAQRALQHRGRPRRN